MSTARYLAPVPIDSTHDVAGFDSGEPALDRWLRERALSGSGRGAARTFVTTIEGTDRVVGYYALAAGAVERATMPGALRRNMPEPVPVIVLARLAVDREHQSRGLGRSLLADAVRRATSVLAVIGVRALVVHALGDDAERFYRRFGFVGSPTEERTLFFALQHLRAE